MPSRPWPFWLLTIALIIGFPAMNWVYWPQVLYSGVLPPESDSVIIPMFESIILAVIAAPFILFSAWLSLRRYNPKARWLAWRRDRPLRSAFATMLCTILVLPMTCGIVVDSKAGWPWYEYLWPAYALFWLPWAIGLRAAAIEQLHKE